MRKFQSTRPHGARPHRPFLALRQQHVSIHAPARGATLQLLRHAGQSGCFNPRARTGRDRWWSSSNLPLPAFQSTRPHGARPLGFSLVTIVGMVSIHAPARGATLAGCDFATFAEHVSIHAPARGATCCGAIKAPQPGCFNPRARTGRDGSRARSLSSLLRFQSTRPHGARHPAVPDCARCMKFQSTRPHGARR